jgi:hypothetical protein
VEEDEIVALDRQEDERALFTEEAEAEAVGEGAA